MVVGQRRKGRRKEIKQAREGGCNETQEEGMARGKEEWKRKRGLKEGVKQPRKG
jgi:hypothetical protein